MTSDDDWLGLLTGAIANPLTLGGIGLMSEGFQGLNQGIKTGLSYQEQQLERALRERKARLAAGPGGSDRLFGAVPDALKGMIPEGFDSVLANVPADKGPGLILQLMEEKRQRDVAAQNYEINKMKASREAESSYGKSGQIVQDPASGKFYSVQYASDGKPLVTPLEIGGSALTPAKGVDVVGDEMYDKATGKPLRNVGPTLASGEAAKAAGKITGEAQSNLPKALQSGQSMIDLIENITADKRLSQATGWQGWLPTVNPETVDVEAKIGQLQGKTFLQAFESLKGGGQITEIEGSKATDAIARLSKLTQSDKGYVEALTDAKREVLALMQLARDKARGRGAAPSELDFNPAGKRPTTALPTPDDPLGLR